MTNASHQHAILIPFGDLPAPRVWSFIVTIFGDLAREPEDFIDGLTLTKLTDPVGFKREAVRVALHRLRNDNWISSSKSGRTAQHQLTPQGRALSQSASKLIYARLDDLPKDWHIALTRSADSVTKAALGKAECTTLAPRILLCRHPEHLPPDTMVFEGKKAPEWLFEQVVPAQWTDEFSSLITVLDGVASLMPSQATISPFARAITRASIVHNWRRLVLRHPYPPASITGSDWPGHQCRARVVQLLEQLPRPELKELSAR